MVSCREIFSILQNIIIGTVGDNGYGCVMIIDCSH